MVVGSLLTGVVADRKGRRKCIYLSCLLQFFVANTFILCHDAYQMSVARFCYGFVYGICSSHSSRLLYPAHHHYDFRNHFPCGSGQIHHHHQLLRLHRKNLRFSARLPLPRKLQLWPLEAHDEPQLHHQPPRWYLQLFLSNGEPQVYGRQGRGRRGP